MSEQKAKDIRFLLHVLGLASEEREQLRQLSPESLDQYRDLSERHSHRVSWLAASHGVDVAVVSDVDASPFTPQTKPSAPDCRSEFEELSTADRALILRFMCLEHAAFEEAKRQADAQLRARTAAETAASVADRRGGSMFY